MTIRLILADDHRMFRETLALLLQGEADLAVVGGASNGQELLALLDSGLHADVLVLDVGLPDLSGIELAKRISTAYPTISIVALSGYADRLFVEEMLKAGARAYVVKSAGADDLIRAIHNVRQGQVFLSPEIAGLLLPHQQLQASTDAPPRSVLGKREVEILTCVANGQSSPAIAAALGITVATVTVHRRNIKSKLGLRSVAELTRYAIREGLVAND